MTKVLNARWGSVSSIFLERVMMVPRLLDSLLLALPWVFLASHVSELPFRAHLLTRLKPILLGSPLQRLLPLVQ